MVFGEMHCSKCGLKYNNASVDGDDYTYTCKNCGQVEIFHMDGTSTTFDCPICAKVNLNANFVPNNINRHTDFSNKYNSQFAGEV
jgi:transcription elongation factor Elf1